MDVVGLGTPCVDLLANIQEIPKENQSSRLLDYSWQGGGKVPTALIALSRLGAQTGIIGVVGDDAYGRFCINDFNLHSVDTSQLIVDEMKETPFSIVLSDRKTQGRNILYHPGNARSLKPEDIKPEYISNAQFLHLSHMDEAALKAAQLARESGVKVVFDADAYSASIYTAIPLIDIFIASDFFYSALFDNKEYELNCSKIIAMGPEIVIFTLGADGCVGMDKNGFFEEPGFRVDVRDTTGAGDVYHGAFILGLLRGWNTRDTARFANAVSAIKCTQLGGRAGIPSLNTVLNFLSNGNIDDKEIMERVQFYRKRGMEC